MTTLVTPEEERKNFEEFFASFLKCPHGEEPIEENVPELSASPKENADTTAECVMPKAADELKQLRKNRYKRMLQKMNQQSLMQMHLLQRKEPSMHNLSKADKQRIIERKCNLLLELQEGETSLDILARKGIGTFRTLQYLGGRVPRNRVEKRILDADQDQQMQAFISPEMDDFEQSITVTAANNCLQTAFDEFTSDMVSLEDTMRFVKHTAWLSLITPPGVIFFFFKKTSKN